MNKSLSHYLLLIALLPLIAAGSGCNAVLALGYLISGPPSIEGDFDIQTGKSLAKKDTTVLVLCFAPTELKWDNDAVDFELAKHVAYRLNLNKIKVVDPDRVHAWLDKNPKWDKPAEVGAAFDVDYVINIDLKTYSLFEEHSSNLYRGRAEAIVSVVEMEKKNEKAIKRGKVIYSKDVASRYPTHAPYSVDSIAYANFKKMYLSRLSEEIGTLFYERFAGDEIPHAAL